MKLLTSIKSTSAPSGLIRFKYTVSANDPLVARGLLRPRTMSPFESYKLLVFPVSVLCDEPIAEASTMPLAVRLTAQAGDELYLEIPVTCQPAAAKGTEVYQRVNTAVEDGVFLDMTAYPFGYYEIAVCAAPAGENKPATQKFQWTNSGVVLVDAWPVLPDPVADPVIEQRFQSNESRLTALERRITG